MYMLEMRLVKFAVYKCMHFLEGFLHFYTLYTHFKPGRSKGERNVRVPIQQGDIDEKKNKKCVDFMPLRPAATI